MDELVAFHVTPQTPPIRFLASLSDGRTVIQDERPGEMSAWHRLRRFLAQNPGLRITCLRLQWRGVEHVTPSGQAGYVFGFRNISVWPGGGADYVGVGYYDGSRAIVTWHRLPDFGRTVVEEQDKETCGFKLIENPV